MNPFPGKNSVLIMDNAIIHKSPELREMVEAKYVSFSFKWHPLMRHAQSVFARGVRLEYLPPYSPDFNPIEEAFSCVKAWIRRHDDWVRFNMEKGDDAAIQTLIYATLSAITPLKAEGWYEHAGYGQPLELI